METLIVKHEDKEYTFKVPEDMYMELAPDVMEILLKVYGALGYKNPVYSIITGLASGPKAIGYEPTLTSYNGLKQVQNEEEIGDMLSPEGC